MNAHLVTRVGVALLLATMAQVTPLRASVAAGWTSESWSTEDGLPSNSINGLLQTRDGYVWIATWNGLVRFDGARFTIYDTASHPSLASNRLTSIYEDAAGDLWLSTEQHELVRYHRGRFSTYGDMEGLPGGAVHSFYQELGGTLWIGGNSGAARVVQGRLERVPADLLRSRVTSMLRDREGAMWFGTSFAGVTRLSGNTIKTWYEAEGLPAGDVFALHQRRSGEIVAGATGGLFRFAGARWERIELPPEVRHASVYAAEEGDHGVTWLLTDRGTVRWDGDRFHHEPNSAPWVFRRDRPFRRDAERAGWSNTGNRLYRDGERIFETADVITATLHDREGNAWLGTSRSGLHRLRQSRFTIYRSGESLASDQVY